MTDNLEGLRAIVGPAQVITDPEILSGYTTDWTGRFRGGSPAVVRPGSVEEVAGVVGWCLENGVAVTPQGGNTGLVGGGVPLEGELVLSLRRLDSLDEVDDLSGQMTVSAGVTISAVDAAAEKAGWSYGVDLGSRETATLGGTIGTNAGGLRMIRYGDTRAQVLGTQAVLGDGSVVSHLSGLPKDNTGYHLPSLLCGSEGTLGVVTAARIRLVPKAAERATVLLAFEELSEAVGAASHLRRVLQSLEAAELFLDDGLRLVCSSFGLPPPFPDWHKAYLLVETAGPRDSTSDLAAAAEDVKPAGSAVAFDSEARSRLWRYREDHTPAINAVGVPHKLDVSVPLSAIPSLVDEARRTVASIVPTARVWVFGHVADGNVHINVTGIEPEDDRVDDAVLRLTAALGGSISAEHGIGRAKRRWLLLNRSRSEIEAFRSIKRALDPAGILNPNVLL